MGLGFQVLGLALQNEIEACLESLASPRGSGGTLYMYIYIYLHRLIMKILGITVKLLRAVRMLTRSTGPSKHQYLLWAVWSLMACGYRVR